MEALEMDLAYCGHELGNFWLNFCGQLITHLESHWTSIENEAPIPNRNLDLAIISPLVNPITEELCHEVHFSEGIFNGSYFQPNDIKAANDVLRNMATVGYWKEI